jgi:ribosomal protein S18 acetylase RimI-like enzyme
MSLVIEPAKASDEPEIQRLVKNVLAEFTQPHEKLSTADLTNLDEHYRQPKSMFFIARMDGGIIGTIGLREAGKGKASLVHQYVDASYRRKGIGTKLLDAALVYSRVCGYKRVELETAPWMHQAQRRYRSRGFREVSRSEDTVLYELVLQR